MKDFTSGRLSTSDFGFAAYDYEAYVGVENFIKMTPKVFGFILDSTDALPSIINVVNAAIKLNYEVIIIDINAASNEVVDYLLEYFENVGGYFEMESYEDRLCFGKKVA